MQVYCVVIDNNRYDLGPELHGVGWGLGNDWQKARFRTDEIPSAIRFSVGRTSPTSWDIDGCIADPIGALATGVANPTCETATFRQLQYAGLPGDPPAGTPVQMFPDCAIPPDMWSTDATCEGSMRYHLSDAERVQDAR